VLPCRTRRATCVHDRSESLPGIVKHIQPNVFSVSIPSHLLVKGFAGRRNPRGEHQRVPRKRAPVLGMVAKSCCTSTAHIACRADRSREVHSPCKHPAWSLRFVHRQTGTSNREPRRLPRSPSPRIPSSSSDQGGYCTSVAKLPTRNVRRSRGFFSRRACGRTDGRLPLPHGKAKCAENESKRPGGLHAGSSGCVRIGGF